MATPAHKKLEVFTWSARDHRGRRQQGEISAANIIQAKAELRQRQLQTIRIRRKGGTLFSFEPRIRITDMAVFGRQLATMINSGVPMVQALDVIISGADKPALRDMISQIRNDVAAGSQLAVAMAKYPRWYSGLYRSLVHVGEESGTLDTILLRLADYQERMQQVRAKVRKAMIYPVTVLVVALLVTIFLLVKVVPQFQGLYAGFGHDLPALTQTIIAVSTFLRNWWWLLFGTLALGITGLVVSYRRSPQMRTRFSRFNLRLPIFGKVLKKGVIARFARTLSTMFNAGVPLVTAMESVAEAVDNLVYRRVILEMRDNIAAGEQLHTSLRKHSDLFPNMVVQMIAIGEESGRLDNMLGKIAEFYEDDVNNTVDNINTLIEPLIVVILGVVVGGLVLAMYLPIFQMGAIMH